MKCLGGSYSESQNVKNGDVGGYVESEKNDYTTAQKCLRDISK